MRLTAEQYASLQARGAAPTKAVAPAPYEADVLAAILEYLSLCRRVAWFKRMNVGGALQENSDGSHRYIAFAFKGCSDIIGQMKDGRFLAIECKRPGKNATPDQWQFLCEVNRANGIGIVATSIEDVRRVFG